MLNILEVVIGLAFVFAFVSLIASMINEWIAGVLAMRGRMLWRGVGDLVGQTLGDRIHQHPLVAGLKHPTWFNRIRRLLRLNEASPAYVPTATFVLGLMASLDPDEKLPTDFASLRASVEKVEDPVTREALVTLVDDAAGDFDKAKKGIGTWFDTSMNEVSAWYKRWSQMMLLVISLALAAVMGIDSLAIGEDLWTNDELREGVVAAATDYLEQNPEVLTAASSAASTTTPADPAPVALAVGAAVLSGVAEDAVATGSADSTAAQSSASSATDAGKTAGNTTSEAPATREDLIALINEFEALDLPLSSLAEAKRDDPTGRPLAVFWLWLTGHLWGFLLTGLAASLGAPFWFDVVNRFVNLRAGFKHAS